MTSIICIIHCLVPECKKIYKSLRDSARYRRKKMFVGKSGDSGDDEEKSDGKEDDSSSQSGSSFAFLSSTQSRNPRKTKTLGLVNDDSAEEDVSAVFSGVHSRPTAVDDESSYSCVSDVNVFY